MSHYPIAPQPAFSPANWLRTPWQEVPDLFFLCGRVFKIEIEALELWSQQGRVKIKGKEGLQGFEKSAREGDWVAVKIKKSQLTVMSDSCLEFDGRLEIYPLTRRLRMPPQDPTSGDALKIRSRFLQTLHSALLGMGLMPVETPSLVPCPGMEPTLEPFSTQWEWGRKNQRFYLPTSPELHLKKLLAQGWTDIYEIKTCYRNRELSEIHQPEFLMLEWYRAFQDLNFIRKDLERILDFLFEAGMIEGDRPQIRIRSYPDLFEEHLGFRLQPHTSAEELRELCRKFEIHFEDSDDWDDLFFRLSLEKIEPQFERYGALIVQDFPPSQAALARLTAQGWADRFEFYWRGFEIANAFHELNDPKEQKRRFEKEIQDRQRLGTSPLEPDSEFLRYLESGMPPAAGIALGVERLLLACQNRKNLKEFRAFCF